MWPIEERRVPQTDVPGEMTARTQPVPTKPLPFEPQGLRDEDLIDFTPELKQEALKIVSEYRYGPMFMPPSVVVAGKNKGTLIRPNLSGGANWQGAAADPETGILYVSSLSTVGPIGLKQDPEDFQHALHRRVWRGLSPGLTRRAGGPASGEATLGAHHRDRPRTQAITSGWCRTRMPQTGRRAIPRWPA